MHDTPPPTIFGDGSFNSQVKEELEIRQLGGGKFNHRCKPTDAVAPYIAHIKVQRGNGESIYFDPAAENSVIRVVLDQDDGTGRVDTLEIFGDADFFQFNCDSKMKDKVPGNKHRNKYEHPGKGPGQEFHIGRITVEKPAGTVKFDVIAADAKEEYQIMIWHIGDPPHVARAQAM